jgi:creatinine amidohydrolase
VKWENLTSVHFKEAVEECGVCILPIGVLERHADHAPLGTDMILADETAAAAAEIEQAVVFPSYYFGQINEAKCFPGALTIPPRLALELLENVISEIARNGFKKIIIYNTHGGNWNMINYFMQYQLYSERDYTVYVFTDDFPLDNDKSVGDEARKIVGKYPCHAGEWETSRIMSAREGSVDIKEVDPNPGLPLGRLSHLKGSTTPVDWYADFPRHYDGDAREASKEKGDKLQQLHIRHLSQYIKAVKEDKIAPALMKEIFQKQKEL